ncbi:MarR family winged helix-turn-helix transcriptional regulator [Arthrobacter crystallopoietes]|uniref:MarR family winged helix-turn-helix transcriptional regulator n=1 Tax=Crystallibacter crystallopoietes TaxID=37928 RepID=UPI001485E64C|nr:MarR family transcriptional regulator [Arthrobacter crystallopoietes]
MADLHNQSTARLLSTAARLTEYRFNEELNDLGLSHTVLTVLAELYRFGPASQNDLARNLRIQPQTLGATLRRMESNGLLLRNPRANDRRVMDVLLSPGGARLLHKAREAENRLTNEILPDQHRLRISLLELIDSLSVKRWPGQKAPAAGRGTAADP